MQFNKKRCKARFLDIMGRKNGVCVKKSQKKKKKKNFFKRTFSLAVFLFAVIKRGKKVSGFVYFRKGRGKM